MWSGYYKVTTTRVIVKVQSVRSVVGVVVNVINMRLLTVALFALYVCVVVCVPTDKTDLKKLKAEATRKKACLQDCGTAVFDPVCAGKPGEKPKSFGNECVLRNHNCENSDNLAKISDGQCPGSEGIRLS